MLKAKRKSRINAARHPVNQFCLMSEGKTENFLLDDAFQRLLTTERNIISEQCWSESGLGLGLGLNG